MVVPTIPNPNRHRVLQVAKATKSNYHLEPEFWRGVGGEDHTLVGETEIHRVGRRTKGYGGYGSTYSSRAYAGSGGGANSTATYAILGIVVVGLVVWVLINSVSDGDRSTNHDQIRTTRNAVHRARSERVPPQTNRTAQNAVHGGARSELVPSQTNAIPSGGNPVGGAIEKQQVMRANFYYQTVYPDKSNLDPDVLREEHDDETSDDDSVLEKGKAKMTTCRIASKSDGVVHQLSSRFLLSTWRRPTSHDECSICLSSYDPGQTICMSKNPRCKHIFHQECIEEWLKDHSDCPLCRSNLMMYSVVQEPPTYQAP